MRIGNLAFAFALICATLASKHQAGAQEFVKSPKLGVGKETAVTAELVAGQSAVDPGQPFSVAVKFHVPESYYVYYKTGGTIGLPTKIRFSAPAGYAVGGPEFPVPEIKYDEVAPGNVDVSFIYKKDVLIPCAITPPADAAPGQTVEVTADVSYQYCKEKGSCIRAPPKKLALKLPIAASPTEIKPTEHAGDIATARRKAPTPGDRTRYARVSARFSPDKLSPGGKGELTVDVDVEPGHHIQMNRPPVEGLVSTDLVVEDVPGIERFGLPNYPPPEPPAHPVPGFEGAKEYRGRITIRMPVVAKDNLAGESVTFTGLLRYQACKDGGSCYLPMYASFAVTVPVTNAGGSTVAGAEPSPAAPPSPGPPRGIDNGTPPQNIENPDDATKINFGILEKIEYVEAGGKVEGSLPLFLLWAFLGGLILNVMPCVLPVIAIKVLGFVRQAGESRQRILLLNVFYSLGVITVFLVLATLAVGLGVGWGQLFQKTDFNLVMAGIVFAMGLSLLGVFEIPVPGFAGGSSGGHQEGLPAAFMTGILATLLATPCSGPLLGFTLGWSVQQPPPVTYMVWGIMGLGMASPYLLFGLFPQAVRLLPRPGSWMVRFKEFAGFVLMGTVVYIMTYIDETYTLPTLVMLVGLALGFWMVGNLYSIDSHVRHKLMVWVSAVALTVAICTFGFTYMRDIARDRLDRRVAQRAEVFLRETKAARTAMNEKAPAAPGHLPWQPFSTERLLALVTEGKTVMVDFTADWCQTCKFNELTAYNTFATRKLVDELGVATLYADFTQESREIELWLGKFRSISVPLAVVFPGKNPARPIVMRDLVSQDTVLETLRQAGPSTDLQHPKKIDVAIK